MVHNTLDLASEPLLRPELFYGEHEKICDICIITFSHKVIEWALENLDCREAAVINSVNGDRPIYIVDVYGIRIAFFMTMVSSPAAAGCLEEARCLIGAERYIMFGSCGSLDPAVTDGKIIVPTQAYRDEGLSYHYLEPSEYIALDHAQEVAGFLEKNGIACVQGKIWTNDALYRETKNKVERLRSEGCIAVEMESSAIQAVCRFYGLHFYNFLFAGDFFGDDSWNLGILGGKAEMDLQVKGFQIALKFAASIGRK